MIKRKIALGALTAAFISFAVPALAQFFPSPYQQAPRYYQPPPPPPYYSPYQQPYPAQPRVDRRRVVNYCETQVGTCQTPGPTHLGRGCNCYFSGYGKVPGFAVQGGY